MTSPTSDAEVAFHEAAHAVVAYLLGLKLIKLSCRAGAERPEARGYCEHQDREDANNIAVVAMAAPLADALRAGEPLWLGSYAKDNGDHARIMDFLNNAQSLEDVGKRLWDTHWKAHKLLEANWHVVEALATELDRVGTMDGPAAETFIMEALSPRSR